MIRRITVICLLAILWSGCSTSSFVGRRVDNFTAYYNTFYNARKAYKTGFESIERKDDPIDQNRYLSLFVRPSGNTGSREFDSAVVKSADILRDHQDSKWVDDALLLIGKSYFYQENVVGALQKFREVIDRQTDLEDEARFWLARTLIVSRSFDEANTFLQESLAREDVPTKWIASFKLALGELYVQRSNWELAAAALEEGLEDSKDKERSARAQFLLGQVYENMDRPEEALTAYQNVRRYNPLFELDFAARLSAVRIEGIYVDPVRALKSIRKLERDDKYFGYIDELRFMRGRIIQAQSLADDAYNVYFDLLYEENRLTPLDSRLRGRIHYAMGELYRDLDQDYMRAAAHFDTAGSSLTIPSNAATIGSSAQLFSRAAITDANEVKDNFRRYASVYSGIAVMDSLLWLGEMSQEEFDAKILELRLERARLLEEQRKAREARLLEQQFRQASDSRDPFLTRGMQPGKTIPTKNDPAGTQSGFLFHRDPERVADGRNSFLLIWGDRPLVPNWRRIDAVRGSSDDELLTEQEDVEAFDPDDPTTLPEVDISSVPRDSLSQAEMEQKRAISWLDLGNALFLALDMPDSAAVWYRKVIEENPDELVVQRSVYALAEVQKTLGDSESTERLYDEIILQYPESEYALRIREQRGEQVVVAEIDSTELALEYYNVISEEWQSGRADDMINQTVLLAATFPETEAGAKALLAGGEYHLEEAGADEKEILKPLALQLPDSLLMKLWPEKYGIEPVSVPVPIVSLTVPSDSTASPDSTVSSDSTASPDSTVSSDSTASPDSLNIQSVLPISADSLVVEGLDTRADSLRFQSDQSVAEIDSLYEAVDSSEPDSVLNPAFLELVRTDSLTLSIPDSSFTSDADDLLAVTQENDDSSLEVELLSGLENDESVRPEFFVEDLFELILDNYGQTPYAIRALALRTAVDELRNPPQAPPIAGSQPTRPDSLRASLSRLDSTDVAEYARLVGSMGTGGMLIGLDSTSAARLTTAPLYLDIPEVAALLDTMNVQLPSLDEAEAVSDNVQTDSLIVGGDENIVGISPVKSNLEEGNVEAARGVSGDNGWVMLEKYPELEFVDTEVDDFFEAYRETKTLKPLRIRRRLDTAVVGWTVRLESAAGILEARKKAEEYAAIMDTETQKVMILKDVNPAIEELMLTWGIFESRASTDAAVASLSEPLPADQFYILMLPVDEN